MAHFVKDDVLIFVEILGRDETIKMDVKANDTIASVKDKIKSETSFSIPTVGGEYFFTRTAGGYCDLTLGGRAWPYINITLHTYHCPRN